MRLALLILFISTLILFNVGCDVLPEARPIPDSAFGLSPIYVDSAAGKTISTSTTVSIIDGRSFAVLGDTIFIVDNLRGIHVIDNRDPATPVGISFISIPGCSSVAINGNFLYVNNLSDLVTLDISDPLNAVEVDREPNLYPIPLDFPEEYVGYFACFDPKLGYLTGWQEGLIESPQCYIE